MTTTWLQAEFANVAVKRGGLVLFRPGDAIVVIRRCRELDLRILGVDGFLDRPTGIQPSMENSIDFSTARNTYLLEDSWRHAERFIRDRELTPFLFEVIIESPPTAPPTTTT